MRYAERADVMSESPTLDTYRRAIEELLDGALQLRWELAQDVDRVAAVEQMEHVRDLARRVDEQRGALGGRAADTRANVRLGHATKILEECSVIMADQWFGGSWPGTD